MAKIIQIKNSITSCTTNKDKSLLAIGLDNGNIQIWRNDNSRWEWISEKVSADLSHKKRITGLDWCHKNDKLASCSADKQVHIWSFQIKNGILEDLKFESVLFTMQQGHVSKAITCLEWSPHGNKIAFGSANGAVGIAYIEKNYWKCNPLANKNERLVYSASTCVAWSPDNINLAVGSTDKTVKIVSTFVDNIDDHFNIDTFNDFDSMWTDYKYHKFGRILAEFKNDSWIIAMKYNLDGDKLAFSSQDSCLTIVENTDLNSKTVYSSKKLPVTSLRADAMKNRSWNE